MTGRMRTSRAGLELIKAFEGFREAAARLPDGRWIIGFGHVRTAREGITITEKDAEDLLRNDLRPVEDAVRSLVFAPLNQAQFDALVSLTFNISPGQFKDSDILRRLNEGDLIGAAGGFDAWRRARVNGRIMVVDALVRRRAAEKALFLSASDGRATAPTPIVIPEWDPTAAGVRAPAPSQTPDVATAIEKLAQERTRHEPASASEPALARHAGGQAAEQPDLQTQVTERVEAEPATAQAALETSPSATPEEASRTVAARIARILERADKAAIPAAVPEEGRPAADARAQGEAPKSVIEDLPDFSTEASGESARNGRKLIDDTERFDPGRAPEELFTNGLQVEKVVNGRARKLGLMDNRTLKLAPFVAFLILSVIGLAIGLVEVFRDDTRSISGASTVVAVFGLLTVMGIYFVAANATDADR